MSDLKTFKSEKIEGFGKVFAEYTNHERLRAPAFMVWASDFLSTTISQSYEQGKADRDKETTTVIWTGKDEIYCEMGPCKICGEIICEGDKFCPGCGREIINH